MVAVIRVGRASAVPQHAASGPSGVLPAPRAPGRDAPGPSRRPGRPLLRPDARAGLAGSGGRPRRPGPLAGPWPLRLILAAQVIASARLIGSNTAFPDEALYLWAGHAELAHLLHGTAVPDFPGFFSGAPVLYPPLGALADAAGGLAAARLLSALLMAAATWLLHGTARDMFGTRAALLAAGLFAGLASTQFLGAFATYDALALFLLALACRLGIRAAGAGAGGLRLAAAAAAVLALATAVKYAAAIFDPVVLCVAACWAWHRRGPRAAAQTAMVMFWTLLALLGGALAAAGGSYWHGVTSTTLARPAGSYSAAFLWFVTARWIGVVAVLALIGAAVAVTDGQRSRALAAVTLAAAALLAPAEQARIHTYTSLFKHDGYGAWFACAAAGYALASLARVIPAAKAAAAWRVAVATVALAAVPGVPLAAEHYGWPPAGPMIARMARVLAREHGPVLADDRGNLLDYYLRRQLGRDQIAGTWFWSYADPGTGRRLTGLAAYADAIRHRYFAVVVLSFWDTYRTDLAIERDISVTRGYRLDAAVPYRATGSAGEYLIWVRAAAPRPAPR